MSPRSILFLSTQLPYPPKSGGTIKSWNYVKDLSKRYKLGIACLLKDNDAEYVKEFQEKISLKQLEYFPLDVPRNPLNLLKSYLGYPCLNVYRNFSKELQEKVQEIASEYDLIIVDHYEVFQYVPSNYKGKIVLHTHNAEFELWKRMVDVTSNPLMRVAIKLEADRVLKYEKKIIKASDLVYATPSDIECYRQAGIDTTAIKITYHLGNNELLELPQLEFNQTEKALLFMGTLSWQPNIDGLIWFIREIYPELIQKHPDLKFYVLGELCDDQLKCLTEKHRGIELCGFVSDIELYLSRSRVFLAPLRFGSGMKVKVLEGMYRGIPMVTTEVGAEGIDVEDGEELMIAKNEKEFINKTLELLENSKRWGELSRKSRKKAAEQYTWQPLFQNMDVDLRSVFR